MSRSPYLSTADRRRELARHRRRRLARTLAVAVLAVVAVLLVLAHGSERSGTRAGGSAGSAAASSRPVQLANGPVADTSGPRPLAVRLDTARDPVRLRFHHPPSSGLLFDLDTGRVLWRHEPDRVLPIASLTKMMTALLVVENEQPHDRVLITPQAVHFQGSGVGVLPRGKSVQLETLLYGLLLPSGNDAAIALAQKVGGTQRAFVAQMNAKASALGLRCTHFTSPSGFYDAGNHSCAVDLAALARADLDEPRLATIVRTRQAVRPLAIKGGRVYLYNNNPLLRMGYPGVSGMKTGYTDKAGSCLVATATRHGRRLGVILLHSPNTGDQARKLLDRGFAVER